MDKLMMTEKELKEAAKKDYPEFGAGDIIKVYYKIKEKDKERLHPVEGIVMKIQGEMHRRSFTVRTDLPVHRVRWRREKDRPLPAVLCRQAHRRSRGAPERGPTSRWGHLAYHRKWQVAHHGHAGKGPGFKLCRHQSPCYHCNRPR